LHEEHAIWIVTVSKEGIPQPNPVGFLFQEEKSILIYNMVNANRLNHVAERPQVALHFDSDGTGGDIVVFTGTARRADDIPPPLENPAFLAKYGDSRSANCSRSTGMSQSPPTKGIAMSPEPLN
jgi:PPOX class probable F420-dependent enzyme